MTDLILKPTFTDRSGNQVYDVLDPKGEPFNYGQVRIPPDPRIKELKARIYELTHPPEIRYICDDEIPYISDDGLEEIGG